jgi:hypothetical protein
MGKGLTTMYKSSQDSEFRRFRPTFAASDERSEPPLVALLALAGAVSLISPAMVCAERPMPPIPDSLTVAMGEVVPGGELLGPQEVDERACSPVGGAPGIVQADFDGDERDDYALLLKTESKGRSVIWEGRELQEAAFSLVLFLDDGNGGYDARVVRQYTALLPTLGMLGLQPAGGVRHRETKQTIKLENPGVTLFFCEKSATTYYLLDGEVRSIPIAD